jgi:hypothetical protein
VVEAAAAETGIDACSAQWQRHNLYICKHQALCAQKQKRKKKTNDCALSCDPVSHICGLALSAVATSGFGGWQQQLAQMHWLLRARC